jgi:imidazolonepropionase-like amidohydrolase
MVALPVALLGQVGVVETTRRVIEGGTLIDGTGGLPLQDSVVVIEGNRITAIGPRGKTKIPEGAEVIQATGKFILPGLSDMHVHWDAWMPELFLAHGVTSAVDLDSYVPWIMEQKDALRDGRMRGPRLFTTTSSLSGRLIWDSPESPSRIRRLASPEMARRLTRAVGPGRERYNLTKTYTEVTPDQLQAVVEESHKAGRNVMAHLGSLDARQAALLEVDGIAHGSGIALAVISDPARADELRSFTRLGISVDYPMFLMYHAYMDMTQVDDLVRLLVEQNVGIEFEQVNTAGRWVPEYRETWLVEDNRLLQDPNLHYIPQANRDRILYYEPYDQLSDRQRDLVREGYEKRQDFIGRFARAGGKVLAGCDTASFVLPGVCIHRELELLVEAGLTSMQAIQAATRNNFEFLQEEDLGTLRPGKTADLIILREDPLADIRNTRTIDLVIQDGKVVDTRYHADFVNPIPNPFAGGGGFVNPSPSLRVIYPMSGNELNQELTLIIEGNNLADESVVEFDGTEVPSTPVKSTMLRETMYNPVYTQLEVTIPARLLNRYGSYRVIAKNPRPHGGVSNALTFFVTQ